MKQEKKRLLVVAQHYWPENFRSTDLCQGFVEDGWEVDVLCGLPNYPQGEWFDGYNYFGPRRQTHEGVEIFRAGEVRRKGNTSLRIFLNFISFPVAALCSLPRLHGRKYDAVLSYETAPVFMLLPAIVYAKLHRVPLTCYVLDLWPDNLYSAFPVNSGFLRKCLQVVSHWHYRRCDRLIGMSDALCETLRAIAPSAEVAMIPQYCEDFYADQTHDPKLDARFAGRFNVLFAGNISPVQGLELLVACAVRLKAEDRRSIHFVLVGDGMSRADIERQVDEAGVGDWFTFEGQHPAADIPQYQAMADALYCSLAKIANLGLTVPAKLTSYLAAGRPCLVAVDGEASRLVDGAGCGLTCGAGDADALYDNLCRLAAMDGEARAAMGRRARACYEKNFRRDKLLRQLEKFVVEGGAVE